MVLEAQGGIEPRAAAILHRIASAVAKAEGTEVADAKREMLERIGVILARANSQSVARRAGKQEDVQNRGVKRALETVNALQGVGQEL